MKRILFVHKSLCIGGAEQVLLKYLQICSARADWHITLLLHQCLSHNINIEAIPSNVSIVFLLSKKESRLLEQIEQKMENPNTDFDFLNYRNLLRNRIADFLTHNPVDLIINYNTHFDLFLEKFQMRIPVVRFIHGIVHLELWYGSPEYYQHILKKHSALIAICDEMHELMRWVLDKLDLQISTYTLYNPFDANEIREKAQQIPDNSQDRALLAQLFYFKLQDLHRKKPSSTYPNVCSIKTTRFTL